MGNHFGKLIERITNEAAKRVMTLSVFCPADEITALEKAMMNEFFKGYRANRESRGTHG